MRGFFRYVLLALILVTVAFLSALTAMRIAIHGREVVVPKLVGLPPAQAEHLALQHGLLVEVENRFYSTDVPEGRIMSQVPPAGEKVRRGWRVRLAESLGPQHVDIPDVVGQSSRAAVINLRRRGLEPGTLAYAHLPNEPQDRVVAQSPTPKATGVATPKVNMLLAAPTDPPAYVMPNFVGRPLAEATRSIQEVGMKLGHVHTAAVDPSLPPPTGPAIVSKQSPTAGQKVTAGATVDLEVSR